MEKIIKTAKERAQWVKHTAKLVAVAASSGAALVSIFTALYSYGVIGASESHQSIGNIGAAWVGLRPAIDTDRKSTRLNSSHLVISYAVFCLKKKKKCHLRVHFLDRHALPLLDV